MKEVVSPKGDLGKKSEIGSEQSESDEAMCAFDVIDLDDLKVQDTNWMKAFKGDLRSLDVIALWRAAGLKIVPTGDGVSHLAQCPNRMQHSNPEASSGTVLYKRPGAIPGFYCGRTNCRCGQFSIREALLRLGAELVDTHCAEPRDARGSGNA